ncbi:efflux RND transporter periplasmic adaptor subunit [Ramlibacter humi]|uniref:HlyD family efflux transporter periplasmic adaptor subunit n=1 Tax=Ramlibacter humi TaxID=2530451 RepID=A0A4Z0CEC3_9BURK|nr:efflux RND transporter periplasmic adaptor subunit [Ramlibacter humi]TFZ08765.1 HlyD family efflux transporter periplasmic adaptor subunit [Ramlibacter humi]
MRTRTTVLLAALAAALVGCSDSRHPVATAHAQPLTQPRAAAVARGKVEMPGGMLEVAPPVDGVVASVAVAEGAGVRRGDLLLTLDSPAVRQDLATAQAELALAQARQRAQAGRAAPARDLLARWQEAARAGAADPAREEEARQSLREAESGVAVADAEVQLARVRVQAAQSQVDRLRVTAPQDGSVLALPAQPGSRVAAQGGRALAVLLPARPALVRAEVNESFAPAVKAGMKVAVVPDGAAGDGARALAGQVMRISPVWGPSRLDEDAPVRSGQRVLECWIALQQPDALRVGQTVRVTFHE